MNNNDEIKLTKEQLLYLEGRVKKLIDSGNYHLASIMATNISKYLNSKDKNNKQLVKTKRT